MNDNKTSQAFQSLYGRRHTCPAADWVAIMDKYQKMEEALKWIEPNIHLIVCSCKHTGEWCEKCEQSPECKMIREALRFDPLNEPISPTPSFVWSN